MNTIKENYHKKTYPFHFHYLLYINYQKNIMQTNSLLLILVGFEIGKMIT